MGNVAGGLPRPRPAAGHRHFVYPRDTACEAANVASQQLARNEIDRMLQAAPHLLPECCETFFLLSYQQELPVGEIARSLKTPVQTAENQLYRARKFLRVYFRRHDFSRAESAFAPGGFLILLTVLPNSLRAE